jgi:ACT domain-containing protein
MSGPTPDDGAESRARTDEHAVGASTAGADSADGGSGDDGTAATDGAGAARTHTLRLELVDEPGELLRALEPIADEGGNLLSIFHERGSVTPRGRIPVEVDVSCPAGKFDAIVDAVRESGVNVVQADTEHYGEAVTVVLVGDLVETDLSDTLERVEACAAASVADFSLAAADGTDDVSSARLRLAAEAGSVERALTAVRSIADEKSLTVVEPLVEADR